MLKNTFSPYITEQLEFRPLVVELEVLAKISLAGGDDAALGTLEGVHGLLRPHLGDMAPLYVHLEVRVFIGAHVVTQRALHLLLLTAGRAKQTVIPSEDTAQCGLCEV